MKATVLVTFLSALLASPAFAQEWELAKEKKGITVYTRESEGSPIKEFKAVTTFDHSLEDIVKNIKNVNSYPEWYDHCKKTEILDSGNEKLIYHLEVHMPFPFDNRDTVNEMVIDQNDGSTLVKILRKDGMKEEIDGIIRMPVSEGSWKLVPIEEQKTKVIHQFKGDPAGNIPSGIVNMFLVAGPINTLTQLQEYIAAND